MVQMQNYQDPSGEFGNRELKYSFWYVRNTLFFYRLIVGVLVVLVSATWIFSLVRFGAYLLNLPQEKQQMMRLKTFVNYAKINQNLAPQALSVDATTAFASGVGKYDIISQLANPNPRFLVKFDYYFTVDGQNTPVQSGFLLPRQSSVVGFFGYTQSVPTDTQLVLRNFVWERISTHKILNLANWQASRLDFVVADFTFVPPESVEAASAAAVQFTLTNNTPYGYKTAHFYAGLYRNDGLVGVIPFQVDNFSSLEARPIDLRSFADNLSVDEVRVFPAVNLFDQNVYLLPDKQ